MNKLIPFLIFILFAFNAKSQEYSQENEKIPKAIKIKLDLIGKEILKAVKNGKVVSYNNDSLSSIYSYKLAEIDTNEHLEGIQILFTEVSEPDQIAKKIHISAIAPVMNLYFGGIEIGLTPMFFVKLDDLENILSKEDLKMITILANLMFGTYLPFELNPTGLNQDILTITEIKVSDNFETRGYIVQLTDFYLQTLGGVILNRISEYFEDSRIKGLNKLESDFYKDNQLQYQYSNYGLDSLLTQSLQIEIIDPNDTTKKIQQLINEFINLNYFQKVMISNNAIGLKYESENTNIVVFYPKDRFFLHIKSWEAFLINELLK